MRFSLIEDEVPEGVRTVAISFLMVDPGKVEKENRFCRHGRTNHILLNKEHYAMPLCAPPIGKHLSWEI